MIVQTPVRDRYRYKLPAAVARHTVHDSSRLTHEVDTRFMSRSEQLVTVRIRL